MNGQEKQDLVRYRLSKAKETLREATLLKENGFWNAAASRLYYACFYAVSALLINNDITSKTHSGIRNQFGQHFINTGIIEAGYGRFYTEIFNSRQKGDYSDFLEFNDAQVTALTVPAEAFVSRIDAFINKDNIN